MRLKYPLFTITLILSTTLSYLFIHSMSPREINTTISQANKKIAQLEGVVATKTTSKEQSALIAQIEALINKIKPYHLTEARNLESKLRTATTRHAITSFGGSEEVITELVAAFLGQTIASQVVNQTKSNAPSEVYRYISTKVRDMLQYVSKELGVSSAGSLDQIIGPFVINMNELMDIIGSLNRELQGNNLLEKMQFITTDISAINKQLPERVDEEDSLLARIDAKIKTLITECNGYKKFLGATDTLSATEAANQTLAKFKTNLKKFTNINLTYEPSFQNTTLATITDLLINGFNKMQGIINHNLTALNDYVDADVIADAPNFYGKFNAAFDPVYMVIHNKNEHGGYDPIQTIAGTNNQPASFKRNATRTLKKDMEDVLNYINALKNKETELTVAQQKIKELEQQIAHLNERVENLKAQVGEEKEAD